MSFTFGPGHRPADQVFVLGDNRCHSFDSRYFGSIGIGQIRGKVLYIYWSPDRSRLRAEIQYTPTNYPAHLSFTFAVDCDNNARFGAKTCIYISVDYAIIIIYFVFVLGIGFALRGRMKTSEDFFLSGRSIPGWITGLAFMSANLGALEVMGHAANAAKYGMFVNHFYWLAAMPAMCFVGVFMMPFYYGSKVRSVPEYLRKRYDEKTRTLNALSFAVMTLLVSGVDLYAMAILFQRLLHWPFGASVVASAAVVAIYIYLGGLTSSIYNEVLQFFLIVFGFLPLAILGLKAVGGFAGLKEKLPNPAYAHTWANIWHASQNPMGINWFGTIFGLGFVLSFGYWCTDFLVVQRGLAARDMPSAHARLSSRPCRRCFPADGSSSRLGGHRA